MAEVWHWLQDVTEHLRVARRRKALRAPGRGVDHAARWERVQAVTERLHPRRMRLRVVDVVQETPSAKTYRLVRTDGPLPPFRPGQYVNVLVDVDGVRTSRPYSIVSQPGEDLLELTVKDKPGGFVAPYLLNQVEAGDELETTGPAGTFYHEPLIDGEDLVFLAGGSGMTPFMSIIRTMVCEGLPLKIHLLYGCRVPDDVIYGDELAAIAAGHPGLQLTLVISEPPAGYAGPVGFLDAALIRDRVGDVAGKTFYVCGPSVMYDFCLEALEALGVPRHKIKRELYGPPANVTREPGWPAGLAPDTQFAVEVVGRQTIRATAGEPLLNTLERYGVVVPAMCRAGECSTCRVQLLAGRVFMPEHAGVREADRANGYIHACVSYPLEDLRIRV